MAAAPSLDQLAHSKANDIYRFNYWRGEARETAIREGWRLWSVSRNIGAPGYKVYLDHPDKDDLVEFGHLTAEQLPGLINDLHVPALFVAGDND